MLDLFIVVYLVQKKSMSRSETTTAIRICGGLGNQFFQLGAALLIASKGSDGRVVIDNFALSNYKTHRKFELSKFIDLAEGDIPVTARKLFMTKFRIPKLLSFKNCDMFFVNDHNFQFVVARNRIKNRLLDGYFQNLTQKDFDDISILLKSLLIYKFKKLDALDSRTCVIHIRGGDFIDLGWNKATPKEYYVNSMNAMSAEYGVRHFIVVTDDISYAKSILPSKEFDLKIISGDIVNDFQTIATYSKRILSASTFALWASALGVNDDVGVVMAPNEFTPRINRNFLLPNERRSNA